MFTIMVVEDDLALQRMMCAFLGMNGYQTVPAANGEEALDAIERVMPDLVIADVMMPVMDGWELTEELRSAYPLLPIMLVTARDSIQDKRTGFTAGADDVDSFHNIAVTFQMERNQVSTCIAELFCI